MYLPNFTFTCQSGNFWELWGILLSDTPKEHREREKKIT